MPRFALLFPVASFALLCHGCTGFNGYGCVANVEPGIEVRIVDTVTGLPPAGDITVTATGGDYSEELRMLDVSGLSSAPLLFAGAYGRPGTYTVRVEKSGYERFEQKNVRVKKLQCGNDLQNITVNLKPIP